jgi:hypothetical protein
MSSSDDATLYAMNAGFQTPTSDDHRPWVWVVTLLSLIYSFLCLGARMLAKWEMFWWDDAILGMSMGNTDPPPFANVRACAVVWSDLFFVRMLGILSC